MNITRLNFNNSLPFLLQAIRNSHFVAFDLEMSGIMSTADTNPSLTDSMQIRYSKTKQKIAKFIPLQLGICTARCSQSQIIYSPFNLYIYPMSLSDKDGEEFAFNSQSLRFLAKNNFDFNQLFYEGLPFLSGSKSALHQATQRVIAKKERERNQILFKSPDVAAFMSLNLDRVNQWISDNATQQDQNAHFLVDIRYVKVKAYLALIQKVRERFPSLSLSFHFLDANSQPVGDRDYLKRKYIRVSKSKQPSQTLIEQQQACALPEHAMFDQIWEEVEGCRKPIIVHNGYLDLMHVYHRFFESLPEEETEYRRRYHKRFPHIFDTKFICSNPVLLDKLNRNTSLDNCYKTLRNLEKEEGSQEFESVIDENCGDYSFDQIGHHEAGYDALMTCYTFIRSMRALHKPISSLIETETLAVDNKYYLNKIPLGNIRVPYILDEQVDHYSEMGTRKYEFKLLRGEESILSENVKTEVENRWGSVRILWKANDSYDFVLTFIRESDQQALRKQLDEDGMGLCSLGSQKYLITVLSQ